MDSREGEGSDLHCITSKNNYTYSVINRTARISLVGILGAFIGGWVVRLFGVNVAEGQLNFPSVLTAVLGAVILLAIVKIVRHSPA